MVAIALVLLLLKKGSDLQNFFGRASAIVKNLIVKWLQNYCAAE